MSERLASVMVIGSGGREHALAVKYAESPHVGRVLVVLGNDFMRGDCDEKIDTYSWYGGKKLSTTSINPILAICEEENITLVDVAQDNAVAVGLVDRIRDRGGLVVGPTKIAGEIEWGKIFARTQGEIAGMPQPQFEYFLTEGAGQEFIDRQPEGSWFIKYDGLADGKGALPAKNKFEAKKRITQMVREFGTPYLIEEWLKNADGSSGEEFSSYALFAGNDYVYIGDAQDHKRVFEHDRADQGENTGGMGCSGLPLVVTNQVRSEVIEIFNRVPNLLSQARPYTGILYLGGMLTDKVYVLEFNARWGDPEAQIILPSIKNDWFEVSLAAARGDISSLNIVRDNLYRVVVAGVAKGYPGDYKEVIGKEIYGLNDAKKLDGVKVFGAGIKVKDGKNFANGGRLFYIVGESKDVIEARERAYSAMDRIRIDGGNLHYRKDIGWMDMERGK